MRVVPSVRELAGHGERVRAARPGIFAPALRDAALEVLREARVHLLERVEREADPARVVLGADPSREVLVDVSLEQAARSGLIPAGAPDLHRLVDRREAVLAAVLPEPAPRLELDPGHRARGERVDHAALVRGEGRFDGNRPQHGERDRADHEVAPDRLARTRRALDDGLDALRALADRDDGGAVADDAGKPRGEGLRQPVVASADLRKGFCVMAQFIAQAAERARLLEAERDVGDGRGRRTALVEKLPEAHAVDPREGRWRPAGGLDVPEAVEQAGHVFRVHAGEPDAALLGREVERHGAHVDILEPRVGNAAATRRRGPAFPGSDRRGRARGRRASRSGG